MWRIIDLVGAQYAVSLPGDFLVRDGGSFYTVVCTAQTRIFPKKTDFELCSYFRRAVLVLIYILYY